MGDSTLRPTPSYNANIPVVTAAGGTESAYKDPNSPESILKKTTELNAQTAVDTKFDAAMSPYHEEGFAAGEYQRLIPNSGIRQSEGFRPGECGCNRCPMQGTKGCPMQGTKGCPHYRKRITNLQILLFVSIILFTTVVSLDKLTTSGRIFLITLCIILIGLILNQWAAV
jgi:hypothetical protein